MNFSSTGSVTVRLKGGLGNQLFQYASGRALAAQLGSKFYVDAGWFLKPKSNREYKLPDIGISADTKNSSKPARITKKLSNQLLPTALHGNNKHISEPADFGYHPLQCNASQHIYMDGYWQSEKYFIDIRQQLLNDINLDNIAASPDAVPFASDNTVAVHIRRGDYITQSSSQALSTEYVKRAMADFGNNHDFMFFSDDINWCKETFTGNNIAFSNNQSDLQDLKQMSEAAHNIIANSTFSWWSAWLNKNQDQRVIAPQPWTNDDTHKDILPTSWEKIALG